MRQSPVNFMRGRRRAAPTTRPRVVGPTDEKLVVPPMARRMARRMARQRRQSLADQVRGAAAGTRIALVGSLTAAPGKEAQSGAKSLGCQ